MSKARVKVEPSSSEVLKVKRREVMTLFTYPSFETKKGVVVNEVCCCGAAKTEHEPRKFKKLPGYEGSPGHGACARTKCKQFTWEAWVLLKTS